MTSIRPGADEEDVMTMTDAQLVVALKTAVKAENEATTEVIRHLAEFDRRKLYADRGFPSLFAYCTQELGYSEDAACKRIAAARAAEDIPQVFERLERADVHLSAVVALAPHLTPENADALLEQAAGKTKREVEFLAASLAPEADRADCARTEALSGERVRIHFSASRDLLEKIDRLRALLRHKYPKADFESVLGDAVDALLERMDPGREPKRARAPKTTAYGDRRVPRHVRRAVWRRDGGRCAFRVSDGKRCAATGRLEFDHVVPFGQGGRSDTPANIRLLCRAHNQLLGRLAYQSADPPRGG